MVRLSSMMVAVTAMVLGISALDDKSAKKLKDELTAAKIIPDAFENLTPLTEMKIIYNGKEVKNGDTIKPSEAVNRPGIQFTAPDKKKHYTLVMEDLDTPAPHVRHWIATNIKGADAENVVKDPSKMQDYVPYKGPTPPGKDVHRYVFALYEQSKENQKMTPKLEDPTNHRAFFDVNKFAKENKLKLVAATYINSEHQEGYESHYSKTDKRSLARRAVANKKGYTPNDRLVRRDGFDGYNIQRMSPREQVVNGGDGYVPSAGINGQYGGTWNGGQSFNSGYGQPSNGGQGGYDNGANAIVAGNGPSGNGPSGNIAGNYDPNASNVYYVNGNPPGNVAGNPNGNNVYYVNGNPPGNVAGNPNGNNVYYVNGNPPGNVAGNPNGNNVYYVNGNPPTGSGNWYYNGANQGGNVSPPPGGWYYGNGGVPVGSPPPGGVNGNWYFIANGGNPGTANGNYNVGGGAVGGSGSPNGNGGIVGNGGGGSGTGNGGIVVFGGNGSPVKPGNGGISGNGGGSGTIGNGGLVVFNPGNGGTVGNGGGSGTTGNGGVVVFNPGNGGTVGNGGGSGTTGNGGVVVVGGGGVSKPTPVASPGATTSYYTYFYTINGVDYKPGQTYRGSDGQLYRIPFPSATPNPNLHRRDEVEEEQNEKKEEASMNVVEFDEGSGLNEDDVKLYNGIQDAIRAMDEAADDLKDLVVEIYLGEDEVVSVN